ncbi:MAG: PorT family protein [Bacteroidetes bacterium]|nr:PorT family protein [Bacteroidota bacterium]MBL7103359.1 PorT family protein [Bacteroidales bacterium]
MKKIFLISIIIFLCSYTFAQLPINFGIKGAFTMSKLTTDVSDYTEAAKNGFQAGVFLRLGKKLHIQPEAYFTLKKGELKYDIAGGSSPSIEQTIKLSTIDVPVLLGYKIIDISKINVRLQAGPVASFVVNKNFDLSVNGVDQETDDDYKDSFKDMNWGLQLGAGVDVLMLTIDLRYELGLSNLYDKPDNASSDDVGEFKNNVFLISVGWKIL